METLLAYVAFSDENLMDFRRKWKVMQNFITCFSPKSVEQPFAL